MVLRDIKESGTPDLDSISLNKRYKYRQRIRYDLEKRFRIEYLGYLKQPSKHKKEKCQVQVIDIVFVSSDNHKKIYWPLARVIQLFNSKDGDVRLTKVKMKNGEFLHPIDWLIPLELSVELDPPTRTYDPDMDYNGKNEFEFFELEKLKGGRMLYLPNRFKSRAALDDLLPHHFRSNVDLLKL
ncbi:integrase catalytic domain-containing protein [Trichonephila clavata]|uniref:Integrase catalytic domain-containing protein n=1 Tax=Trichonephila clavata TaxID=2740835 RepID=A0A8X6IF18_TRICU|nr:integrase catalytic domain-containing protein [Trichonephila clavata]